MHLSQPSQLREIENNAYAKFWVANNVHYGICASGVFSQKAGSRFVPQNSPIVEFDGPSLACNLKMANVNPVCFS